MGCIFVYGALFGIAKILFQHWFVGLFLLAGAAADGYLISRDLKRRGGRTFSG
jgi:hypothetical protein